MCIRPTDKFYLKLIVFKNPFDSDWAEKVIASFKINVELGFNDVTNKVFLIISGILF